MVLVAPRRKRVYTASEARTRRSLHVRLRGQPAARPAARACNCTGSSAPMRPTACLARADRTCWLPAPQVATHCTPSDCWVSLLGRVLDITSLLRARWPPAARRAGSCMPKVDSGAGRALTSAPARFRRRTTQVRLRSR